MTDEGKARQKARGYDTEYAEDFIMSDMLSRPQDFNKQGIKDVYLCLKEKHYRDGYLDGLAEGKPKWHDLRKNPDDLPKEGEEILVLYSNFYDDNGLMVNKYTLRYKLAQYINDEDDLTEWYWVESGLDDIVHEVIAWCELPKFEE